MEKCIICRNWIPDDAKTCEICGFPARRWFLSNRHYESWMEQTVIPYRKQWESKQQYDHINLNKQKEYDWDTSSLGAKAELMYQNACEAQKHNEFIRAHELFCKLENYKDSAVRAQRCLELDQKIRQQKQKEQTYNQACEAQRCEQYNAAIRLFRELGSYNDSRSRMNQCKQAIRKKEDEARQQEEKYKKYTEARLAYQNKNYDKALQLFGELGSYKDSGTMWQLCANAKRTEELYEKQESKYKEACYAQWFEEFDKAIRLFRELGNYKKSEDRLQKCIDEKKKKDEARRQEEKNRKYKDACLAQQNKNYDKALQLFRELDCYKDSETRRQQCANAKRTEELYEKQESKYKEACYAQWFEEFDKAIRLFRELGNYKKSEDRLQKCIDEKKEKQRCESTYQQAQKAKSRGDYARARELYQQLGGYKDSAILAEQCLQQSQKADITEQTNKKPILSTLLIALVINIFMGATVEKMALSFFSYSIVSCESGTLVYLFKPILLKEFVILGTQWYGFEIVAIIYGTVSSWIFLMYLSTKKWRAFLDSTIVGIVIIILTTLCGVGVMFFTLISEIETSGLVNKFVILIYCLLIIEGLVAPILLYDNLIED